MFFFAHVSQSTRTISRIINSEIWYVIMKYYALRWETTDRSIDVKVLRINYDDNEKRNMHYESAGIIKNCSKYCKQSTYFSFPLCLSRKRDALFACRRMNFATINVHVDLGQTIYLSRTSSAIVSEVHRVSNILVFAAFLAECIRICKAFNSVFTWRKCRSLSQYVVGIYGLLCKEY